MSAAAERHLLFGLIALQNGLIDQARLVAAFQAWTLDRSRALADYLVALGYLDVDDRAAVEALTERHLKKHGGDTERSLAAIPVGRSTREHLVVLGDAELSATIARIDVCSTQAEHDPDADRTSTYAVGASTADGQRFRVLRPHARGGLGAVFVALDSELNREVALKQILDGHADDPASRQRFVQEAEITGGLEHPGIVPVYGLGTYGDGRPYYAMRFIRGDSLKEAIERFHKDNRPRGDPGRRSLELRRLLRRFLDVCNAIEYAHSRGVLHRDIKPGNVIVGKHGETLVVDWGLAKALGRAETSANAAEQTLRPSSPSGSAETLPGQAMGTPAYMSPEQARGDHEALGPRSDVYSLGATLYCLLTGKAPFEVDVADVLRAVQRGDVRPPRSLDPSIDPALEAVCLRAMATTSEDRYGSCRALAGDIERWLADEPVSAYREPAPARLLRWCRRHRTTVAGLAATLLAAVVALAVGTVLIGRQRSEALRQRDRAEGNLDLARQIVEEMYTRAAGRLTDRKGMDAEQRDLLVKAARFYERFALPQSADPAVRLEAGRAGLRAGEILDKLGQTGPAEAAYGRALRLLGVVAAADPADTESRRALADGHYQLAGLYRDLGKKAEAEASLRRAAEIHRRLAAVDPGAAAPRRGIAIALIGLGNIENDLGRPADAENSFREALSLLEDLTRDHPGVTEYRSDQATAWNCLADLQRRVGRSADAMASWERALASNQVLARDHPDVVRYRAALARVSHNLGTVQSEVGRPAEAIASYRRAAELREALVRDHPDVPLYRDELAGTYNNHGNLLRDAGKPSEARHAFEQAVAIKERLALDHPDVAEYRSSLAISLMNLGFLLVQIGSQSEALATIERAAALQERLVRDHPDVVGYRGELASSLAGLGSVQRQAGKADEALRSLRRALKLWDTLRLVLPTDLYNLACVHAQCSALIDGGRPSLAPEERAERESHAEQAVAALRRALAAGFAAPEWLRQDPDLDPLRSRNDFGALMMDLVFPADPFAHLR